MEDPIVMYLVVRESLNMSIGKTAAQCAHASQMLQLKFNVLERKFYTDQDFLHRIYTFRAWLDSSYRKVTLKADDKEWARVKNEILEEDRVIVVDAGLTEIAPGSETCVGLWPMKKSQVPKIIKRLQILK
jgi:peptidyl-tRNA hydrolase, PTH2 family